jgi:hypothetical protein
MEGLITPKHGAKWDEHGHQLEMPLMQNASDLELHETATCPRLLYRSGAYVAPMCDDLSVGLHSNTYAHRYFPR